MQSLFEKADAIGVQLGHKFRTPALALCTFAMMNSNGVLSAYPDPTTGALTLPAGVAITGAGTLGTLTLNSATTPTIVLASGSTNTGTITINGKTSGALILTAADATAQNVTVTTAAQTSGASTLTIPNFAGVNDTFVFVTLAQTLSNKTFVAPVLGVATGTSLTVTGVLKSSGATSGIGYATGAGGTITQASSRTTGVTLNTVTGAITLVSAAGSATPASFTLTNSAIAATDVVQVSQKSGTDKYEVFVTNVAAGSCQITFFTTGGTTTEQPVFNFVVLKGVTS